MTASTVDEVAAPTERARRTLAIVSHPDSVTRDRTRIALDTIVTP